MRLELGKAESDPLSCSARSHSRRCDQPPLGIIVGQPGADGGRLEQRRSSSTMAGTLPSGETTLSCGEPMTSRPSMLSNGSPSSSSVQRTRAERVGLNSKNVIVMASSNGGAAALERPLRGRSLGLLRARGRTTPCRSPFERRREMFVPVVEP